MKACANCVWVFCCIGSFLLYYEVISTLAVTFQHVRIQIPGDGVVTGHGLINGRPVFLFSQVRVKDGESGGGEEESGGQVQGSGW